VAKKSHRKRNTARAREKISVPFPGETMKIYARKLLAKAKLIGKKFNVSEDAVMDTNLEQVESEVLKTEMIFREGILSKMTYTDLNNKRFIKIKPYTIWPKRERRRLPSPFASENKTSKILIYNQILIFSMRYKS
jgi:hypothetical protein